MNKFEHINILESLNSILQINTKYYSSDFQYDKEILTYAVAQQQGSKTFLWMSRSHGTWCFPEQEVFLKGTPAHSAWTYYSNFPDILAYAIELSFDQNQKEELMGNLYQLDYLKHVQHVKEVSLSSNTTELTELLRQEHRQRKQLPSGNIQEHISKLRQSKSSHS